MKLATVLVMGGGAREHALAVHLAKSVLVGDVVVWPGNAGCTGGKLRRLDSKEPPAKVAKDLGTSLVVIGPEGPLVEGVADQLQAAGVPCFGPTRAAARLEWSKAFSKDFFTRHSLPTARYHTFTDFEAACAHVKSVDYAVVLKASGLAAGKGVLIPPARDVAAAVDGLRKIMVERAFGAAGDEVVIEELLEGEEVSVLALCDGKTSVCLPGAQDHKRALDGDQGLNTGGMGAYAPAPCLTPALQAEVASIVQRTMEGLATEGTPFIGCLFAGLMLTRQGPMLLEYNTRMGDPETQVVLPLLRSDLYEVLFACATGQLANVKLDVDHAAHCATVVVASSGYPEEYAKGMPVLGLAEAEAAGAVVFHAGTAEKDGKVVANGGRVLAVTGLGRSLREAVDKAYAGVGRIAFDPPTSMHFRKDIAARALRPETKKARGAFTLETLGKQHVAEAALVLYEAFSNSQYSWAKAVGRDSSGMKRWMEDEYLPERAEQAASLVALDQGVVVGVLAIEPFKNTHDVRGDSDKGMRAIQAILGACDDIFIARNAGVQPAEYFAFVGVAASHRRLGIADALVRQGVKKSQAARMCAHCVSPDSAAVFSRNGFSQWGSVPYGSFEVDEAGVKYVPFASLAPHACNVMVRDVIKP